VSLSVRLDQRGQHRAFAWNIAAYNQAISRAANAACRRQLPYARIPRKFVQKNGQLSCSALRRSTVSLIRSAVGCKSGTINRVYRPVGQCSEKLELYSYLSVPTDLASETGKLR
jgi:hypothetical protein